MRPHLIDFNSDGSIFIDPAFLSMPEIKTLVDHHRESGRAWVEVLVRLYSPRSPLNPFLPEKERIESAIHDTRMKHKTMRGTAISTKHPSWFGAVERVKKEMYDSMYERYLGLEKKCYEFEIAINNTPVIEAVDYAPAPKAKGRSTAKKKKFDDEEDFDLGIVDVEDGEEPKKYYINNTKLLDDMRKASAGFHKELEEVRSVLMHSNKGKAGGPSTQTQADLRKRFESYGQEN